VNADSPQRRRRAARAAAAPAAITRISTVRPQRRFSSVASWLDTDGSATVGASSMCSRLLEVVGDVVGDVIAFSAGCEGGVVDRVVGDDVGVGCRGAGCWADDGCSVAGGGCVACLADVAVGGCCVGGRCWVGGGFCVGGAVVVVTGGAGVFGGRDSCGNRHTVTVISTDSWTSAKQFISGGPMLTRRPPGPPVRRRRTGSATAASRTAALSWSPPGRTR
jgi:hypothetical protein